MTRKNNRSPSRRIIKPRQLKKSPGDGGFRPELLFLITVFIAIFVVFGRSIGYSYVFWDDEAYTLKNPYLTGAFGSFLHLVRSPYLSAYMPVTFASYYLDSLAMGFQPAGFHFTNVLL